MVAMNTLQLHFLSSLHHNKNRTTDIPIISLLRTKYCRKARNNNLCYKNCIQTANCNNFKSCSGNESSASVNDMGIEFHLIPTDAFFIVIVERKETIES